ncbi:Transmembrane emp24 domain-containing protein p24delta3 [Acorus gramineus]|uniref:Transmembrane emp24 domain-containing protein p24delta3 n=1 Tax=Acorus gramineus TaxID=55184 RepID=A0AAV9BW86_ACOGR|nr:Transmembrane emp24 domain-containing protein p24delta3 [Acorus gramineus]
MGWMMVLILLLLLLLIELGAEAFVFHLPSGRTRCISEDIRLGAVSVAHYRIVLDEDAASGDQKISIRVSDPYGDSLHQTEGVESGLFAFTAAHTGQYTACFWSPHFRHSSSLSINFTWKSGVAAKDWTRVAKREKLDGMEMELKKLEDSAHAIHEEMIFLRKRSAAMASEELFCKQEDSLSSQSQIL